ncbi:MAG: hypothetical protein L6262_06440 [Weeksellaceae bacterium]|nr:hypothetical protein [Weeksellaceae bacterium]
MKKLIIIFAIFASVLSFSQVGIGTPSPQASSILDLTATDKALLLPRIANTGAVSTPTNGMVIYDISFNCIKSYENGVWSTCLSSTPPAPTVDCNMNGFTGVYTNGNPMSASNKFSVTITNNSFNAAIIAFQTSDLVLSGVSGITVASVSIPSVTLNPGQSQLVEYTLSGTPAAVGTLTGTWSKLTLNCVKTVAVTGPAIASLVCASATNNGTLTQGTAASGVSSVISYTGGNGSAHSGQVVTSTGVAGLTATLLPGTFATGSGTLTYTITGTPASAGTASFAINIGGQACTLTRTVASPITIPTTITLALNRLYLIASVYDQDYLPYTAPVGPATTNTVAANGVNETVTVNWQGSITTTGVNVKIPVTVTGVGGTLPAYSTTINIPASLTEDGISRDLTLSWTSQVLTTTNKYITANIKAVGGTLNAKKLDINAGVGNDALGVLMGQFVYPYNNAGTTSTYTVRDIAGIPDKMFGQADNTGDSSSHLMLYLPTVAEDGNIWLNNNLGAYYSTINNPSFNLAQQATGVSDYLAYGSQFQWGRKPDGHELMNWTSSSAGVLVNGTTTTQSNNPSNALFIIGALTASDWRLTQDDTLWATEASANNPCPIGFRLPTAAEQSTMVAAAGIGNITTAASSALKLPGAGYINFTSGLIASISANGRYWSSEVNGTNAIYRLFDGGGAASTFIGRAYGHSVRCIKN